MRTDLPNTAQLELMGTKRVGSHVSALEIVGAESFGLERAIRNHVVDSVVNGGLRNSRHREVWMHDVRTRESLGYRVEATPTGRGIDVRLYASQSLQKIYFFEWLSSKGYSL